MQFQAPSLEHAPVRVPDEPVEPVEPVVPVEDGAELATGAAADGEEATGTAAEVAAGAPPVAEAALVAKTPGATVGEDAAAEEATGAAEEDPEPEVSVPDPFPVVPELAATLVHPTGSANVEPSTV